MMHTIRPRALLCGMLSGVAICAVTPFANSYLKTTPLAGGHFPLAAFFVFFASAVLLALLAKLSRRAPLLSGMELLTAWALMVVVSGIGFTGLVRTFFINITAPAQFADSTNGWAESLLPLLPEALYPRDPAILEALYNGAPGKSGLSFMQTWELIPWSFWLPVLGAWSVFIFLAYATLFCLANLFTAQWVVNERINFPLLQMPKLLAEAYDEQRLFTFLRDPFLVCGLCIPVALHLLGGLSAHIPSIPALPTEILAGSYFPATGFLSGFQKLKIYLYPAFIGFAFITTRQVSLSFWFFFLFAGLLAGVLQTSGLQIPDSALGTLFGPIISRPEETDDFMVATRKLRLDVWQAAARIQRAQGFEIAIGLKGQRHVVFRAKVREQGVHKGRAQQGRIASSQKHMLRARVGQGGVNAGEGAAARQGVQRKAHGYGGRKLFAQAAIGLRLLGHKQHLRKARCQHIEQPGEDAPAAHLEQGLCGAAHARGRTAHQNGGGGRRYAARRGHHSGTIRPRGLFGNT